MADSTDFGASRFHVDLGAGVLVTVSDDITVRDPDDGTLPALVLRMPAARAHSLAHVLEEWSRAFGLIPDTGQKPSDALLARGLETVAAAVREPGAVRCAARESAVVGRDQRVAAVALLREREEGLSALQRIAVVDAAARWIEEEAGDELARALLAAVCSTPVVTNEVYLALLLPADGPL